MKAEVNKIINDFLNLTGDKTPKDFKEALKVVAKAMRQNYDDEEAIIKFYNLIIAFIFLETTNICIDYFLL